MAFLNKGGRGRGFRVCVALIVLLEDIHCVALSTFIIRGVNLHMIGSDGGEVPTRVQLRFSWELR